MVQTSKKYLILTYDNTLNGLLSAIFDVYRLKLEEFDIRPTLSLQEDFFKPILRVSTNKAKANRIKIGLKKRTGQNLLPYLQGLFEDTPKKEEVIYQLIKTAFATNAR